MTAAIETVRSMRRMSTVETKRKIVLARVAGFCFGVRRAVDISLKQRTSTSGDMATLGPLVHNEQVTASLKMVGISKSAHLHEIDSGTVILSAHGVSPLVRKQAEERGLNIVDVTCPFVTKVHRSALMLHEQGYQVILVGDPGHTEVKGVLGALEQVGGTAIVVASESDVDNLTLSKKVGIVSQTTQYARTFALVVAAVCQRVTDVRAINTVCGATDELQDAALEMAKKVDLAIVVGGVQSANSRRLREICAAQGIPAYLVEKPEQINEAWLKGIETVGITAGASTPDSMIEAVAIRVCGGELPADWSLKHPD